MCTPPMWSVVVSQGVVQPTALATAATVAATGSEGQYKSITLACWAVRVEYTGRQTEPLSHM